MEHPYYDFLHLVQKPGRYLGGEYGLIRKPWDSTAIRVALAFPDTYEVGMSHMGLKILYQHLNGEPDILAERVFAPWVDLERELRSRGVPLVSLENGRPLPDFDCLGFSLQYELNFTNLLNILDLGGIPLRSRDRSDRHPLIVAGGPVAVQPEPLAPFIDCFLIGDGEGYFARFLRRYRELRDGGMGRQEILPLLAALGGVYCPSLYEVEEEPLTGLQVVGKPLRAGVPGRVERRIVDDLNAHPFPDSSPVPSTETIFDRYAVELARGCTESCRFCQAGMIYRPVRERNPDRILTTLMDALRNTGYDEASLTSLSTADYSSISPLVRALMEVLRDEKASLSVSSLRAYGLPDHLLEAISGVRNTSLTFAPEAGTQRLRDVISKNISREDMERSAHGVFSRGWKKVKLYFMIGLPTEEEEDVRGIARTAENYLAIANQYFRGNIARVTTSVSSFVPKPHTPFQWVEMNDIPRIQAKQDLLRELTRHRRMRLKWHDPQISHIEALMARGDRRMADLVEYAFRNGCRFDGWGDQLRFEVWMRGIQELGIDRKLYLQEIPLEARLPWDHIDVGVSTEFMKSEYRKALLNRRSPPCGKPFPSSTHHTDLAGARADQRKLVCFQCGLECDLDKMREHRIENLERLESAAPPPSPVIPTPAGDLESIRDRNVRPRTRIENPVKVRYRLCFSKLGPQRFISHLDMVRLLPRIFRRAAVPLAYSQGFHPKPRMSFSPALGLGWGSLGEYLDVVLAGEIDPAEIPSRLNAAAPEGILFSGSARLERDDRPLSRIIEAGDYLIEIPRGIDLEPARARASRIHSGEPPVIRRNRRGRIQDLDCSSLIRSADLDCLSQENPESPEKSERNVLHLRLLLNVGPSARPGEIFHWITGSDCRPQDICRTGLWKLAGPDEISPLDLETLRMQGTSVSPGGT